MVNFRTTSIIVFLLIGLAIATTNIGYVGKCPYNTPNLDLCTSVNIVPRNICCNIFNIYIYYHLLTIL